MSLHELSNVAGISRGHLWNLTSGSRAPTTDVLAKLGAALDVDQVTFLRPWPWPWPYKGKKGPATGPDDGE